jgi:hypothetical protein
VFEVTIAEKTGWAVVVDGDEGKFYDSIIPLGEGKIVFDSPNALHYMTLKGDTVYLIEEKLQ